MMNCSKRIMAALFGAIFLLGLNSPVAVAEQVWNTNKSNGCRFSIPVHSKEVKITDIRWDGPCQNNLAEGEGPIQITFYQIPNEKSLIVIDGTMTMTGGMPNGKALLRWNFGLSFEGEYRNGERTRGVIRYDGETYDGEFYLDVFHGKGTYRFKNGDVYEGDWAAGKRNGFGKLTAADGKVKYQGEWKDNHPINDPALTRTLKGFLSIPWGTSRADTEKAMKARDGNYIKTNLFLYKNGVYYGTGKTANGSEYSYFLTKFNGQPAFIWAHSYEDKFYLGKVVLFNTEQDILSSFETVRKDLTERYGAPTRESGKFMDSMVVWDFQGGHFIGLKIERLGYDKVNFAFLPQHADLREIVKRPFNLALYYAYKPVYDKVYTATVTTNKTDY